MMDASLQITRWKEDQGCLLTNDKDEFVPISDQELKEGHYLGLISQKKLNTPPTWVWQEAGQKSSWQNPSPKNH